METVEFPPPGRERTLSPLDNNAVLSPRQKANEPVIDLDAEEEGGDKPNLHIEARLRSDSRIRSDTVSRLLTQYISKNYHSLSENTLLEDDWSEMKVLADNVDEIRVAECADPSIGAAGSFVSLDSVALAVHVYRPTAATLEEFSASADQASQEEAAADGDDVMAASVCELPAESLEGLWESLIYEEDVKRRLLNYIAATIDISDLGISSNIISWHRLVLLHGPPGTGKTSLCRALAQKLAIRLSGHYSSGKLVEINSHSLFSKWFSESGKLVQRLFTRVTELCDDESCFVTLLIDEVESLTAARAGAMSGKEPSDALRVVNALLTQLDKLKLRKNVLVLTTSNLSAAIDPAFVDRADIKMLIPNPPAQAAYAILASCLRELCRSGLVKECMPLDWPSVELSRAMGEVPDTRDAQASLDLRDLADLCKGMSGRSLRRLPVLAHARLVMSLGGKSKRDASAWIKAMSSVCRQENAERDLIDAHV